MWRFAHFYLYFNLFLLIVRRLFSSKWAVVDSAKEKQNQGGLLAKLEKIVDYKQILFGNIFIKKVDISIK
jgi:hypothetical protein